MTQPAAPLSTAVKVVTGLTLGLAAAFGVAAVFQPVFLVPALIVAGVSYGCYLYAPVAYELSGDRLIVRRRWGEKEFGPVQGCAILTERPPLGLRLWGNGGLFAATGIFWNRPWGVFRVYVTSARYQDMVLVTTPDRKILISPEHPEEFLRGCGPLPPLPHPFPQPHKNLW